MVPPIRSFPEVGCLPATIRGLGPCQQAPGPWSPRARGPVLAGPRAPQGLRAPGPWDLEAAGRQPTFGPADFRPCSPHGPCTLVSCALSTGHARVPIHWSKALGAFHWFPHGSCLLDPMVLVRPVSAQ